ncbi:MAG: CotH kinase family protein [Flavobacteriales bacterium]|nr:CotH kinase family protein [Flavobacteriales bacterium]
MVPFRSAYFGAVHYLLGILFLLATMVCEAQRNVVINELQAANRHTFVDAEGDTPDWIEVYNPGSAPVDMAGMRFAVAGRQHVVDGPLVIDAGSLRMLWFDGLPERGADHIGFRLPRMGGTLLLVDIDGSTIKDVFTYPAMVGDLSVGRLNDGTRDWTFFTTPTPGAPNHADITIHTRAAAPMIDSSLSLYGTDRVLALRAPEGARIRYTLDGTEPTIEHGTDYHEPLDLANDAVLRARSFAPDQLPSKELCLTLIDDGSPTEGITLALDPAGLMDDSTGINVEGAMANFSRRGRRWERLAMVRFNASGDAPFPVGISIHGSGSRGLAKRSFKLHARDRYDSPAKGMSLGALEYFDEGILRADAGAHNFLRNYFLEVLVARHGLHVDVQPSTPLPLYLNGRYWGMYRWMPPKDAQWLRTISGAEAVDVLEGPAAIVRSGNDTHYKKALKALLNRMPLDSIDALIDTDNLIDLACLDLWTGRADHELNVRCYRPREEGGRWRWVLFDTDLWAPANENSIQRMALPPTPETPFIPLLLEHPELHRKFLARLVVLAATALEPTSTTALVDSIHRANEAELLADHERWQDEMPRPDPTTCALALRTFLNERPARLMRHMSNHTGHKLCTVTIEVPDATEGEVFLEGVALDPGTHHVVAFDDVPIRIEAKPALDHSFIAWKGDVEESTILLQDPSKLRKVRPLFATDLP